MNILGTIINLILVIVGLVAFVWNMVGIPVGIIWAIVYLADKGKKKKFPVKKWLLVTFGGMALLFVVFALYAILAMISVLTGTSLIGSNFLNK